MKHDENIRKVQGEDGKINLFVKKYDIWWPAYRNDNGEVYPDLWGGTGAEGEEQVDNFKKVLIDSEKSGKKELDFSNWGFTAMLFDESIQKLMEFADQINFQGANFCYSGFENGQLENADFSGAYFDFSWIKKCTFRNCNFTEAVFNKADPADKDPWVSFICDSKLIGCNFKDAQLNDTELLRNRFIKSKFIDKGKVNNQKPSILSKLSKFKQSVAENAKSDPDVRENQRDHRQEER